MAGNVLENTPRIAADSVGAAVGYGLFNTARPVLSAGLAGA